MAAWTSRSVGTADLTAYDADQCVGMARFLKKDVERRNVVVPFD
jgi:hypothetical protein